ncbi:MAG: site-2 protease family protein, partial [Bacteroidota bacterium]
QLIEDFRETGAFPSRGDMIETIRGSGLSMVFGDTALFSLLMSLGEYPVPGYEISHYPLLLAGWLGLFFTALNLLPVGQLDGGHVVYALFGPAVHRVVARVTTLLLILSGSLGWIVESVPLLEASYGPNGEALALAGWAALLAVYLLRFFEGDWKAVVLGLPVMAGLVGAVVLFVPGLAASVGYSGWLLWSGLILFLIRMDHPPVLVHEPLTPGRVALGWVCIVIFALCFSIQPILVV